MLLFNSFHSEESFGGGRRHYLKLNCEKDIRLVCYCRLQLLA